MSVFRGQHMTDIPLGCQSRRRALGDNLNYQTPDHGFVAASPGVGAAQGKPPHWGNGAFDFSHYGGAGGLQVSARDAMDQGNRAMIGIRRSDRPGAWLNMKACDVQATDAVISEDGRTITYADLWPGCDLVYEIGAAKLKETVVIKDKSIAPAYFEWTLKEAPGHTLDIADDAIRILDADGNPEIETALPWGEDSATTALTPTGKNYIECTFAEQDARGAFRVGRLTPNAEHMASAVEPVRLDPTATLSGTSVIEDALLYEGVAHANYGGFTIRGMMSSGDGPSGAFNQTARSLGRILNPASNIPAGTLTAVRFMHYQISDSNSVNGGTVECYTVASAYSDWVEGTASGSTQAGSCDWTDRQHSSLAWSTPGGAVGTDFDSGTIGTMVYVGRPAGIPLLRTFTFSDISAFTAWRDATKTNGGIMFKRSVENAQVQSYYVDEATEGVNTPYFEIDYSAAGGRRGVGMGIGRGIGRGVG
jgi:hypothetical protein